MMPMNCPQCRSGRIRAVVTNGHEATRIVRKRACVECGHIFHTLEMLLPDWIVAWKVVPGKGRQTKPTLRVETELVMGQENI